MKMRASLHQFAAAVAAVVLVATLGLSIVHHRTSEHAVFGEQPSHFTNATAGQIAARYGELPLRFEANVGQTAPEVQFVSHGPGYQIFLTTQDAVLVLRHPSQSSKFRSRRQPRTIHSDRASLLRLHFEDANSKPEIAGVGKLPGRIDYFIGSDPNKWRTNVPSYGQVAYHDLYPGVDATFYGNQRQIEYDFVVAPGADPKQIALNIEGARSLKLDRAGNLVMRISGGEVELRKPILYQELNGERHEVEGNYALTDRDHVRFSVGEYDRTTPLVIDPVLSYSTYLGGGAGHNIFFAPDGGYAIAVDSNGDAFVTGETSSTSFPTTSNPIPPGAGANISVKGAVFVTELNPQGTAELYSTYLAGDDGEIGYAIAVDPPGGVSADIYVVGQTLSDNFPGTGGATGFEPNPPADVTTVGIGFIAKIDPTKSGAAALVYSSYLGGSGNTVVGYGDFAQSVAVDAHGNAYVTGNTISTDFPMSTPSTTIQTLLSPDGGNAFLVSVNPAGSALTYSTYLGGTSPGTTDLPNIGDVGAGVAVDSSNNAYLVGTTTSDDFPTTTNAFKQGPLPPVLNETAFVSRIDTTKSGTASLIYSTFLGSPSQSQSATDHDFGNAIGLGPSNVAYVTGQTESPDFPTTPGAYSTTAASSDVAFVTKIDTTQSSGNSLVYSTFLGGTGGDAGRGIQADSSGNAYVAGGTQSTDFPVTAGAFQTALATGATGDGFVAKLNPQKNGAADLVYATYFGGSGNASVPNSAGVDVINAIALDSANNVYVTGRTFSTATSFPVYPAGAFQTSLTGSDAAAVSAAFVAKLTLEPTLVFNPLVLAFGNEAEGVTSAAMTVALTNNTTSAIPITLQAITGTNAGDFAVNGASTTCGASVAAGASCNIGVTFTPSTAAGESATLPIQYTAGTNSPATQNISLTGTGTAAPTFTLTPASLTFAGQLITTTSASQPATVTNTGANAIPISISVTSNFGETDNCPTGSGQTLAGGASCTINVTFTPSAAGPLTGTLTVTSSGVAQTTQLSGTGWDFSLTQIPSSVTLMNGKGSFSVTVSASQGFNPTVSVSCTASNPKATCTASPTSGAPGTPIMINVVLSSLVPPENLRVPPASMRLVIPLVTALLLFLTMPLLRRRRVWLGLAGVMVLLVGAAACSHSPSVSNFSLTLTASTNGVQHTYPVSVTAQ